MATSSCRSLALLCAAGALVAATGCSEKPSGTEGSARFALSSAALVAGVTEVIVTVGPGGGSPFPPFSVNLTQVQGTWSGFITNIPAGIQRSFDVVANDVSHAPLQSGSARADVVAGQSSMVIVNLGTSGPSTPFANRAPVIDYVSSSQTTVQKGGTVRLAISAHDPDQDPVTILWSAACGTFDDASRTLVTWTAPAVDGRCQITAKASDNRGASVSVYLALDVAPPTTGDVLVEVAEGGNASPVITAVVANVRFRSPVEGDLAVDATDANGDTITYAWSSNCPAVSFSAASARTTTFTNPDGSRSCVVTVTVADGKGGQVIGDVTLPPSVEFNLAPVIVRTTQPSVDLTDPRLAQPVQPGEAALLTVEASDPENGILTFTWTTNAGTLDGQVDGPVPGGAPQPHQTTSPGKSAIVFHAAASLPADAKVTVTVRDAGNEVASHDYNFKPAPATGPCANQADGATCDDGNPCTTTSTCQAGTCVGGAPVTCAPPAACKQAGVCQTSGPGAGTCAYADAPTGTSCDDGRACSSPDTCAAGVCMSGPSTCAAGESCNAAGVCVPGTCTPSCSGRVCGPDGCGGTCGTCAAGTCNDTTGVCVPPTGNTVVVMKIAKLLPLKRVDGIGMAGTASYLSGTAVFSPAIDVDGTSVAGAGGSDVLLMRYDATSGTPTPTWTKAYGDDQDQFGKESTAPTADGTVAVIGRVAPGGRLGECVAGPPVTCSGVVASNTAAYESDFLMLVNSATGAVKTGTQAIANGISGQLNSVAVNPALNLIAVCGVVNATSSLCQGTTAASCTPSTAFQGGNTDLVIALFNSAGVLQWARQVGSSTGLGDESCNSVAIAADGTVFAVGKYQDELDLGTGALPSLNNSTAVRHMWVGHFSGSGATLAAAALGTTTPAPAGNITPNDLEIDSAGNLLIGGSFTVSFPVGLLATAGGTDAFVTKLSPSLAGIWAVRLGNTGADQTNALAIAPDDDVVAVGSYSATVAGTPTTGAAALPAPSGTAGQVFVLKLGAAAGATQSSGGYGDNSTQLGTRVAVSGSRVQFGGSILGVLDFGAPTTPIDAGVTNSAIFTTFADIQ